jgi:hypothetical protein
MHYNPRLQAEAVDFGMRRLVAALDTAEWAPLPTAKKWFFRF